MAPSPPKRRKLSHGSEEQDSGEENFDSRDNETRKPTAVKQQRRQDVDDAALYSGGVYNSSLFKLQIDEMLAEVQPNYEKRMTGADDALRRLKTMIEAIEDRGMLPVCF